MIVNVGNRKEEASEKEEVRYLRVMLNLYKILAHYLINSLLNDGQLLKSYYLNK